MKEDNIYISDRIIQYDGKPLVLSRQENSKEYFWQTVACHLFLLSHS